MERNREKKYTIVRIIAAIIVFSGLIQVIPYGRNHANPPVMKEPRWDSPATRTVFFRVCGNCHSNETKWPWYASIAPVSWLIQSDVDEGRSNVNVSEWGRPKNKGDKAAGEVREDDMPPWYYRPLHPEAALSGDERSAFIRGLTKTFGDADAVKSGKNP